MLLTIPLNEATGPLTDDRSNGIQLMLTACQLYSKSRLFRVLLAVKIVENNEKKTQR